jgi:NAD(P)-dependent dehydrogenase (short-subunit alcohol dehydrogenase family)
MARSASDFEELTPEQMERQLMTSLMGPMNVTRAASHGAIYELRQAVHQGLRRAQSEAALAFD